MVVNNDCRTPGWLPRGTDQNELVNAKLEILRLTQELEAAEAKGREAGLEDGASLLDIELKSCEAFQKTGSTPAATLMRAVFCKEYAKAIRALKSTPKSKDTQGGE